MLRLFATPKTTPTFPARTCSAIARHQTHVSHAAKPRRCALSVFARLAIIRPNARRNPERIEDARALVSPDRSRRWNIHQNRERDGRIRRSPARVLGNHPAVSARGLGRKERARRRLQRRILLRRSETPRSRPRPWRGWPGAGGAAGAFRPEGPGARPRISSLLRLRFAAGDGRHFRHHSRARACLSSEAPRPRARAAL